MRAWLEFTAIVSFVSLIGWLLWDDITGWYHHDLAQCAGCRKGAITPGCPVHDPELRRAA